MRSFTIAIVGATGAVGSSTLDVLAKRRFPVSRLIPFASERSRGRSITFNHEQIPLRTLAPGCFTGVDLAFFSAGGTLSRMFAPQAVEEGAVVIDKSSVYRFDPAVPLIVPEVNAAAIGPSHRLISNPNCSTIQLVAALKPLHDAFGLTRLVVSTYQAASGAGQKARSELDDASRAHLDGRPFTPHAFAHDLAFNVIPAIDAFMEDGSTKEEHKMVLETRKILGLPELPVAATCVRVPVSTGHSESVLAEFARDPDPALIRDLWRRTPGLVVQDDPAQNLYPMPAPAAGKDEVFVGRLRRVPDFPRTVSFFCVSDNLLKGAALNGVQIAETLAADAARWQ